MFKKIAKVLAEKIKVEVLPVLAEQAVAFAERELGSGKGDLKKQIAIDFIIARLPIPIYIKPFMPLIRKYLMEILNKAIDEAIEFAVKIMNKYKNK